MKNLFNQVDLNDAEAALKIWVNELVKSFHYNDGYNLKSKIYNGFDELSIQMRGDSLALVVLSSIDYLNYNEKIGLDPVLALSAQGDIFEKYCILVRKNESYKNIKDLKGADIGLLSGTNHPASKLWLDIILAKIEVPDKEKFFKKISTSDRESQLILNLFFGHSDACIVSTGAFSLMKELNPQVGEEIVSIQTSPEFLLGLLCYIKNSVSEKEKNLFYSCAIHINELNTGKQLLSLLKMDNLVPFKKDYLNSSQDLMKEYTYLLKTKQITGNEKI